MKSEQEHNESNFDSGNLTFQWMQEKAREDPLYFSSRLIQEALRLGNLEMSLKDCHVKGVDSYVLFDLREKKEGMARVFFAHPKSLDELYTPEGNFTVGIHNHRFDATLIPMHGTLGNIRTEILENSSPQANSTRLHEFKFSSVLLTNNMIADHQREVYVRPLREDVLAPGMTVTMGHKELHTVITRESEKTNGVAWLVLEGPEIPNHDSLVYSPKDSLVFNREGLYQPIIKEDAEQQLQKLLDLVKAAESIR